MKRCERVIVGVFCAGVFLGLFGFLAGVVATTLLVLHSVTEFFSVISRILL